MLLLDMIAIGNKLLDRRKRLGLTQAEIAEQAGLSCRTYADIERGTVNMRIETFLRICQVMNVNPDEILTQEPDSLLARQEELLHLLQRRTAKEQKTALNILSAYLSSLD